MIIGNKKFKKKENKRIGNKKNIIETIKFIFLKKIKGKGERKIVRMSNKN